MSVVWVKFGFWFSEVIFVAFWLLIFYDIFVFVGSFCLVGFGILWLGFVCLLLVVFGSLKMVSNLFFE